MKSAAADLHSNLLDGSWAVRAFGEPDKGLSKNSEDHTVFAEITGRGALNTEGGVGSGGQPILTELGWGTHVVLIDELQDWALAHDHWESLADTERGAGAG